MAIPGSVAVRRGRDGHRRQGRAVEADLVGLGRPEPVTLLGAHVDDDRALEVERLLERGQQGLQVVARDEPDVRDPEVLEQPPGLREGPFGALYLAYVRDPDGNKLCAIHRVKRDR
jgi:catechol 2,3-dioxygenase-like lactoylglutathione lyase family enzyme